MDSEKWEEEIHVDLDGFNGENELKHRDTQRDEDSERGANFNSLLEPETSIRVVNWNVKVQIYWGLVSLAIPAVLYSPNLQNLFINEEQECTEIIFSFLFFTFIGLTGMLFSGIAAAHATMNPITTLVSEASVSFMEASETLEQIQPVIIDYHSTIQQRIQGHLSGSLQKWEKQIKSVALLLILFGGFIFLLVLSYLMFETISFSLPIAIFGTAFLACILACFRHKLTLHFSLVTVGIFYLLLVMSDIIYNIGNLPLALLFIVFIVILATLAFFFKHRLQFWMEKGNHTFAWSSKTLSIFVISLIPAAGLLNFDANNAANSRSIPFRGASFVALASFTYYVFFATVAFAPVIRSCLALSNEIIIFSISSCLLIAVLSTINATLWYIQSTSRSKQNNE